MKLQMNDLDRTVITSFNTEILRKGDWNEVDGYYYYININDERLMYKGKDAQKQSQKDFDKLLNKGAVKQYETPYINEQEQVHWEAVTIDCTNPDLHGHDVYSILAGENSGKYVWDYNLQTVVLEEELTKNPKIYKKSLF